MGAADFPKEKKDVPIKKGMCCGGKTNNVHFVVKILQSSAFEHLLLHGLCAFFFGPKETWLCVLL